ncbi:type II and III secretion system protein family protein [Gluconacetobacter diazotrophicus]|uniref:Type II and III secretion system protein family protein n=1 Tax=Gluconacetobacter diazotrophicus TaxID=33996 RepID=A0A7W4FE86_GLUDI|nr:type II and III secretion system protein family protein [Gluconacetobacter diazotrophicus]MBB2156037.1 type II and III secretion system protein family protein [Gluconacetobacter diazotrophicus]
MFISRRVLPMAAFAGMSLCLAGADARSTRPAASGSVAHGAHAALGIEEGAGKLVKLDGIATNIFVADPKVVEVRAASPDSMFVFGVGAGQTTVIATSRSGGVVARYTVVVLPSSYRASALRRDVGQQNPRVRIGTGADGSIGIEGTETSSESAEQALEGATALVGKGGRVGDYASVPGSIQVNLKVRIVEMSRSLVRELGVEWQSVNALGTAAAIGISTSNPLAALTTEQSAFNFLSRFSAAGRPVTVETVIDALSQDGLIHSLAEPNLTTVSGQAASFIVGGEYPIPVSSYNNNINVQYKQYGISLAFVPTVLADGRISLHVRPEVSALSTQGAVTLSEANGNLQIPALTVRRADTTVELGSGQSFAIAGLMQDSTNMQGLGLPFLGDIPVLGALFKSSSFQKNESELVIVVTPYLVRPVDNESMLHSPDDNWAPPGDLDRIFLMRQNIYKYAGKKNVARRDVNSDAGFMVE